MQNEPTVFSRIIKRELPSEILYEDEDIIVIKTIKPKAPIHFLGITKKPFRHLHELLQDDQNQDLLWKLMKTLSKLAQKVGIAESGYKLVTNIGQDAGQVVPHLHIHMLGGTKLEE